MVRERITVMWSHPAYNTNNNVAVATVEPPTYHPSIGWGSAGTFGLCRRNNTAGRFRRPRTCLETAATTRLCAASWAGRRMRPLSISTCCTHRGTTIVCGWTGNRHRTTNYFYFPAFIEKEITAMNPAFEFFSGWVSRLISVATIIIFALTYPYHFEILWTAPIWNGRYRCEKDLECYETELNRHTYTYTHAKFLRIKAIYMMTSKWIRR